MKNKEYKAIVSEHLTRTHSETRYVIVDAEGVVLDNNRDEGYRSKEQALTKYEIKTFGESHKAEERRQSRRENARHAQELPDDE